MAELCRFYGWTKAEAESLTPEEFAVFQAYARGGDREEPTDDDVR